MDAAPCQRVALGQTKHHKMAEPTQSMTRSMCLYCTYICNIKRMKAHIQAQHKDMLKVQCPYCDYITNRKRMKTHLEFAHNHSAIIRRLKLEEEAHKRKMKEDHEKGYKHNRSSCEVCAKEPEPEPVYEEC